MIKTFLSVFVCLVACYSTCCQEKIRVPAGADFSKALNSFGIYRFPAFLNSSIFFRNGTQSSGKLNYNISLGEIQFINDPHDTMSIANPEELEFVRIDTVLYYYDKNYLEVIQGSSDEWKLARWQQIKIDYEQLGAYDNPAPGVDVKSYKNYTSPMGSNVYDLTANQNRIITIEKKYFLIDKFGKAFPANKSNFGFCFPVNKSATLGYLKEHNIHFDQEGDLRQLFAFCTTIK